MTGFLFVSWVAFAGSAVGAASSYGNVTVSGRDDTPALYPPMLAEQTAGKLSADAKALAAVEVVAAQRFVTGLAVPEGSYLVTVTCAKNVRKDFSLTTTEAIHGQTVWTGAPKEIAKLVGSEIAFRSERVCAG